MKKIISTFFILLGLFALAQSQTTEAYLKKRDKSDQEIQDPKKNIKVATWENRGILFLDIYQFNTKGLYAGMPATGGIQCAEVLQGKPKSKETKDNKEIWHYEAYDLIFADGKLEKWVETKPIDPDALNKAKEAFIKAIELDDKDKGKFKTKSSTMKNIATIRNLFQDKGVELYNDKNYQNSLTFFESAIELSKFPREKSDTIYQHPAVCYYTGLAAINVNNATKAESYLREALKGGFEPANCYHFLSEAAKIAKDTTKAVQIMKEGIEKHPDSYYLMLDLINFYMLSGQSKEALKYLEQAIVKDDKNPTLFYAKGNLLEKLANDPKETQDNKDKQIAEAHEMYKKSIEVDPKFTNGYYSLGAMFYNKAAKIIEEAQKIPPKETKKYETELEKASEQFKLSMPYMEKAHELDPKDIYTMQALSTIYLKLLMYDKQKEMKAKIDAAQGNK